MRDYGIDKGLVQFRDDSKRNQRGWGKGFFGFRKMFRDYLTKLNVAFFDTCCPAATPAGIVPVRFNDTDDALEYYDVDTDTWLALPLAATVPDPLIVETVQAQFLTAGSTSTDQISELTAGVGVSVEQVKFEDGGISVAGETMFAPFIPAALGNDIVAGTGGAIPVTNYVTTLSTDAGGDNFTLANGTQIGQLKRLHLIVHGGGNAVITPTSMLGGTTITMTVATSEVELMWNGTQWIPVGVYRATIA
jgi:hypothetical protein